ncbi:hypothetical protein DIZ81_01830 [Legionella taurinensis]|uniref:Uncharacterized protein n=1 Tax=Legionella taurinensis TaxID=70611 RepID=A0A3A5LL72_9GAMM|nr:hypothetical protein [Legionella taurinensis]MDX1836390.1 hypothetical protein [Legionella taurinensis]PUT43138.1 hypothetical protein DB744_01835 [Legionella taurinensis]PUT45045.1 hypothetical protein DB743_06720 [Legionella taurinensis]PUT45693.1 hypothetical protein DB746_01835 [Legionella taurinensis]PUT49462.1 hypothetical protein DB745_01835 [Legionella taurinensis]
MVKTTTHEYHHMGIPTTLPRPGERYSERFKMYTSGGEDSEYRIQYHRFEPGCPLHPLIQTKPHVAFKVPDLNEAIKGRCVILEPYEPIPGFKVAMIDECGAPIEFIETTLSEEQIWYGDHSQAFIYSRENP